MRALLLVLALAACTSDPPASTAGSGSAAPVKLRERPAQVVHITMKALGIT
jgi:hypothetical protein